MDLLHKPLRIELADNTPGSSTAELLFTAIQTQYPELGLTPQTHAITHIQHFSARYVDERTIVIVSGLSNPVDEYRFVYKRFRISRHISFPLFTEAELPQVQDMDEPALAVLLTQKTGLNINPQDFLIAVSGISYTGGLVKPNWRLEAKPDSPYWYGQVIIPLHGSAIPDDNLPEPEDPDPELPPDPEPEPEPDPDNQPYGRIYAPIHVYLHRSEQEIEVGPEVMGKLLVVQSRYSTQCNTLAYPTVVLPWGEQLLDLDYGNGDHFKVINASRDPLTLLPLELFDGQTHPLLQPVVVPPGGSAEVIFTIVTHDALTIGGWTYRGDSLKQALTAYIEPPQPE